VRIAKVGNLKLEWSRSLPQVPSSVTIISEPDGRCYASFVVAVVATPLPACASEIGLDLGLETLIATSDGEMIANPRYLRSRQHRIAKAQRAMCRKEKGSANREKARIRLAIHHRKVREARADHLHKLALRLVRDNQAVYVEDLAVSDLARTTLARSVQDAGWSMFVRFLKEKAARYNRSVVKVGRRFPSSQLCSACGRRDGPKALTVRVWTCAQCGATHHRDVNAARNILTEGRRVAAGLAETKNACGGDVRPAGAPAVPIEAGTHRGAA
jgi:putative transposase